MSRVCGIRGWCPSAVAPSPNRSRRISRAPSNSRHGCGWPPPNGAAPGGGGRGRPPAAPGGRVERLPDAVDGESDELATAWHEAERGVARLDAARLLSVSAEELLAG